MLESRLGAGGMGVVWKAWDPTLGRSVALKQIRGPAAEDPDLRRRFAREARLSARLRHPHVVAVHDVGEADGVPFLTMELVAGRDYDAALAEARAERAADAPPSPERLRRDVAVLADVAAAVVHAHAEGVVHRDLKPANVLVDEAGRARVTDFGLARELDPGAGTARLTQTGARVGTPAYMSPEQAAGDAARTGTASDVWSLGAILYETLTGAPPYAGDEDVWKTLERIQNEDVAPPSAGRAGVPADLEAVCLRALARDPARRTPDARAFEEDLRRWLRGEPVSARRPGVTERLGAWASARRRSLAACVAALAVAGLALAWAAAARRAAHAEVEDLLERVGRAVLAFEDQIHRTPMTAEARRELAAQPLGLLEQLIAREPACGPAFAWRAAVRVQLGGWVEAVGDFDRACALTPERSVVWYLRARDTLAWYESSRGGLPAGSKTAAGYRREAVAAESRHEREQRERALADLERMLECTDQDPTCGEPERRLARAALAVHTDRAEDALRELDGRVGPRADYLRGQALYLCGRFADGARALRDSAREWPENGAVWFTLGFLEKAAADRDEGEGGDPRDALRRAEAAWTESIPRLFDAGVAWQNRGVARSSLAHADEIHGLDARPLWRSALADFESAAGCDSPGPHLAMSRGIAETRLALAEHLHGADPGELLARALASFDQGEKDTPDSPALYVNRGQAWFQKARADRVAGRDPAEAAGRAIADYDAALRLEPGLAEALLGRANVRGWRAATAAGDLDAVRRGFAEALADVDALPEAIRGRPAVRHDRGLLLRQRAEAEAQRGADPRPSLDLALADLDATLDQAPDHAGWRLSRGSVLVQRGILERERGGDGRPWMRRGIEDFDRAARAPGSPAPALRKRGLARVEFARAEAAAGGDPREEIRRAWEDFDVFLKAFPDSAEGWAERAAAGLALAEAQAARGEDATASYARAEADAAEAVRRAPGMAVARFNRASALRGLALGDEARRADPRPRLEAALAELDEGLRLEPTRLDGWVGRGNTRTRLARLAPAGGPDTRPLLHEAIADFDEALRLVPGNAAALGNRAFTRSLLALREKQAGGDPRGSLREAIADADAALRSDPSQRSALSHRALAEWLLGTAELERGGDPLPAFARALADYQEAGRRGLAEAHHRIPTLLWELGRWEEAAAAFEAAGAANPAERERAARLAADARHRAEWARTAPWRVDFLVARERLASGLRLAARHGLERGLDALDRALAARTELERASLRDDAEVRAEAAAAEYDLACLLAQDLAEPGTDLAGLRDQAFAHLERALDWGFDDRAHLERDPDLAALREDPRWAGVCARAGK